MARPLPTVVVASGKCGRSASRCSSPRTLLFLCLSRCFPKCLPEAFWARYLPRPVRAPVKSAPARRPFLRSRRSSPQIRSQTCVASRHSPRRAPMHVGRAARDLESFYECKSGRQYEATPSTRAYFTVLAYFFLREQRNTNIPEPPRIAPYPPPQEAQTEFRVFPLCS
jgi:hypothetical protein